jgi:sodium-dependent dicarboxylate transporter 2/3/5
MTSYWVTECIPVAIVSIMPVFLYPMFGILSSSRTAQLYFQDIIMLFFAGIISKTCLTSFLNKLCFFQGLSLAIAIETSGLHERIALQIILLFGSNPKKSVYN